MKRYYLFIFLTLLAVLAFAPAKKVMAQSNELIVEWEDPNTHEVILDALRTAVANDVSRPADRVYKLRKGGFYWITEPIENADFTLRIVGEEPGTTELENPAVIQMHERTAQAGGGVNGRMFTVGSNLELKNLYIIGSDNLGVQTYYQPITVNASNSQIVIDNCIFEKTNFALMAFTAAGNDVSFTNCKFRNLIGRPSTQQWEGRGISLWADQDSVVVENCTFFNVGFTALQIEGGAAKYLRFNHNTLVNVGRGMHTVPWYREAYTANNLIINGFWHGEGYGDVTSAGRDPRQYYSGIWGVSALPSKYGPEQGRRILFANTAAYRQPEFDTYYADTIRKQWFVGPVAKEDFLSGQYPNMVVKDTSWLNALPNFPSFPTNLPADMIQNIKDLRAGVTPAHEWFWMLPQNDPGAGGGECFVCPSWPLPENFSYTTPELLTAGTDGLPLGDLNWFPTQKATFEANKAANVQKLYDMAGPTTTYTVVDEVQAEEGTTGGSASVVSFQGFSYFQMDGGGFIEWTFDLPTAGQYDLNVWTHMRNNPQRGQHTFVNGTEIHDAAHGWGELIYDNASGITSGMPINEWTWVKWTQADLNEAGALTLPAGQNVIKISSSWGYQNFAGIDLLAAGTTNVVKSLRAPDVTAYEIVQPVGEGAPWTPAGFKSVSLGSDGNVSFDLNAEQAGNYALQIFYQNYSAATDVTIALDGAAVATVNLTSNTDSTGLSILSTTFPISAGAHTIKLTGSNFSLDFVQLVQVTVSSGVKERNEVPNGFALKQNYPNPFNPTTNIDFDLGKQSFVSLNIYNILGQKIATLINNVQMNSGAYTVQFDASKLASGIYFYSLEAGSTKIQKKMMLLK